MAFSMITNIRTFVGSSTKEHVKDEYPVEGRWKGTDTMLIRETVCFLLVYLRGELARRRAA